MSPRRSRRSPRRSPARYGSTAAPNTRGRGSDAVDAVFRVGCIQNHVASYTVITRLTLTDFLKGNFSAVHWTRRRHPQLFRVCKSLRDDDPVRHDRLVCPGQNAHPLLHRTVEESQLKCDGAWDYATRLDALIHVDPWEQVGMPVDPQIQFVGEGVSEYLLNRLGDANPTELKFNTLPDDLDERRRIAQVLRVRPSIITLVYKAGNNDVTLHPRDAIPSFVPTPEWYNSLAFNVLTDLNLGYSDRIGAEGGKAIANALAVNGALTHLNLTSIRITDGTYVDGYQYKLGDVVKHGNQELTVLKVDYFYGEVLLGTNVGIMALASALKVNGVLTTLNLSSNQIGEKGAIAMAEALKVNGALTSLNLSYNYVGPGLGIPLAMALKVNGVMKNLYLEFNQIGKEGAIAIADALKVNGVLENLNLETNQIGKEGAIAIADALKVNVVMNSIDLDGSALPIKQLKGTEPVETLDLSRKKLRFLSGIVIAALIEVNGVLTNLNLAGNNLRAEGGKALAEALKVNGVMTTLSLQSNSIGSEGGIAMAEALKFNGVLKELNLRENIIRVDGAKAIAEALKVNGVLTNLDMSLNRLDAEEGTALTAIAEARKLSLRL